MGSMVWGSEIAEVYDATYAAQAVPSVVDPMVNLLAQLVGDGAALEFAVGTGRIALPLSARHPRPWNRALARDGAAAPTEA